MSLPLDSEGEGIMFVPFVIPYIWSDIVTTMSDERLEQFW